MDKKCLIINGSPKLNGNTAFLISQFIENANFDVDIVNAFSVDGKKGISSCVDCGACLKSKFCVIDDDFKKIIDNSYDVVLIASPIYQSNLPGPMINIINRFNFMYNNKVGLNVTHEFKQKEAGLILLGGGGACKYLQGETNEDLPIKQAKYIFNKMNAILKDENVITCLDTNEVSIYDNGDVLDKVADLAIRLS